MNLDTLYHELLPTAPALAAFPVFLLVHLIVWQFLPAPRKGVVFLVLIASIAYLAASAVAWRYGLPPLAHGWVSLPVYAFLVVFYMHLYFGIDRSLSVRILGELVKAENGTLSLAELDRVYSPADMVARRIDVLVDKGHLAEQGGIYTCTPFGRFLVRLALLGKRLYALRHTG